MFLIAQMSNRWHAVKRLPVFVFRYWQPAGSLKESRKFPGSDRNVRPFMRLIESKAGYRTIYAHIQYIETLKYILVLSILPLKHNSMWLKKSRIHVRSSKLYLGSSKSPAVALTTSDCANHSRLAHNIIISLSRNGQQNHVKHINMPLGTYWPHCDDINHNQKRGYIISRADI